MQIETEIVINTPAAAVWAIVGDQFGEAHRWSSALTHTHGYGKAIHGQVCASRSCDIRGMGHTRETLLDFDPKRLTLKYEVEEGFPFFVERGVNRWTLTEEGGGTRVRSVGEITTKGLVGMLMAPMMKMKLTGLMRNSLEELKHYVETGTPHPRKVKAFASKKLIQA